MTHRRLRILQGPADAVANGCALQSTDGREADARAVHVELRSMPARSILTRTSGFIAAAGFTHSLSPARNCTFGCCYCYVPTLHLYAGLRREDWMHWGAFTTVKDNAGDLPCDPEVLAGLALDATDRDIIADPFHTRAARAHGAITREAAHRISDRAGFGAWHDPSFQADVIGRLRHTVEAAGRRLGVGTAGFAWLAA